MVVRVHPGALAAIPGTRRLTVKWGVYERCTSASFSARVMVLLQREAEIGKGAVAAAALDDRGLLGHRAVSIPGRCFRELPERFAGIASR